MPVRDCPALFVFLVWGRRLAALFMRLRVRTCVRSPSARVFKIVNLRMRGLLNVRLCTCARTFACYQNAAGKNTRTAKQLVSVETQRANNGALCLWFVC